MRKPTTIILAATAAVMAFAGAASAFGPKGGLFGPAMREARMAEMLELTDEQRARVFAVMDEARPEARRIVQALRANRSELEAARETGDFDEAKVKALAERQGELVAEMIVLKSRVQSEVQALLSDEQRERMESLHERHRGHGGPHGKRGLRHGGYHGMGGGAGGHGLALFE